MGPAYTRVPRVPKGSGVVAVEVLMAEGEIMTVSGVADVA